MYTAIQRIVCNQDDSVSPDYILEGGLVEDWERRSGVWGLDEGEFALVE